MARKKSTTSDEQPEQVASTPAVDPETQPAPEQQAPATEPAPDVPPTPKGFPIYEGKQVTKILEENVNGQWHHCQMSDGTTKHVPIKLFD